MRTGLAYVWVLAMELESVYMLTMGLEFASIFTIHGCLTTGVRYVWMLTAGVKYVC